MSEEGRIPVICLDASSVSALALFNSNEWSGASRGVIQSCATELAALQYVGDHIGAACASAKDVCLPHFRTLSSSWEKATWDLSRVAYFGQVPAVHVLIEAFFSGLKSFLDLSVQLLSTEGVVALVLNGFHRSKGVYGGVVMNALERNVKKGREPAAQSIKVLLDAHKKAWIDEAIVARDVLLHAERGAQQLMFELVVETRDGTLVYVDARPPHVGAKPIAEYVVARVADVRDLSQKMIQELRRAS